MTAAALELSNVRKSFGQRRALDGVSLTVRAGEMVALIGPSGAGKSTLMRAVAALTSIDRVASAIHVFGEPMQLDGRVVREVRRRRASIGFIFQQFNLVGRLTLLDNVLIGALARVPAWRRWVRQFTQAEKRQAMTALDRVGMAEFAAQRASTLSGGQQQRGAIARAAVQQARLILADEPIASLDPESARLVMQSLRSTNQSGGVTVVVSLHQVGYAVRYCDRVVAMKDGSVVCDCPAAQLSDERLRAVYGANYDAMTDEHAPPTHGDRPHEGPAAAVAEAKAGV